MTVAPVPHAPARRRVRPRGRRAVPALAALVARVALLGAALASTAGAQPATPADTIVALPSVGAAARLAAQRSAGVEVARLRAAQAAARVGERRADLLPSVALVASDGQRTFNTASFGLELPSAPGEPPIFDPNGEVRGPVRTIDVRGRVAAPVLNLGARARVRSAQASASAADAAADHSAEAAALAGAQSYLRALRAAELVRARQADSALAAELLEIAHHQLEAGVGVGLDVTRAEAQVAQARAGLIAARAERDRTRLELSRALGLPLDAPLTLPESLSAALPETPTATGDVAAVADQAAETRADVRAADLQAEAARREAAAVRAERLPTIGVFVDDGATGLGYTHLLNTYTWGLQVSVPLFEGFRREHRTAAQEAAARERLRLAEQEVAQARDRFQTGVSGNADIVSASLALNAARTQLVDALTAQQAARVTLAHASGTVTDLP